MLVRVYDMRKHCIACIDTEIWSGLATQCWWTDVHVGDGLACGVADMHKRHTRTLAAEKPETCREGQNLGSDVVPSLARVGGSPHDCVVNR